MLNDAVDSGSTLKLRATLFSTRKHQWAPRLPAKTIDYRRSRDNGLYVISA